MYATIIQCDMRAIAFPDERGRAGRALATALGALPGFVAFIALDDDAGEGTVAALYIVEDRAELEAADHTIAQWQRNYPAVVGTGITRLGMGAVIVQKGL